MVERIKKETPPTDIFYYKIDASILKNKDEASAEGTSLKENEVEENGRKLIVTTDTKKVKVRFCDLPISRYTSRGLFKAKYLKMTDVQRCAIPHALADRDLLVCARTGSGKTLCYLAPVIEKLYR